VYKFNIIILFIQSNWFRSQSLTIIKKKILIMSIIIQNCIGHLLAINFLFKSKIRDHVLQQSRSDEGTNHMGLLSRPRTSPNKSGIKRNRGRNDAAPGLKIFPTSEHSITRMDLPVSALKTCLHTLPPLTGKSILVIECSLESPLNLVLHHCAP